MSTCSHSTNSSTVCGFIIWLLLDCVVVAQLLTGLKQVHWCIVSPSGSCAAPAIIAQDKAKHELETQRHRMTESTSGKTLTEWQQMIQGASSYLPMSLSGRGPYLSIKIPRGKVAALKRNEPMVKPRFKISSCSTQLGHTPLFKEVVLVWTVSLSVDRDRQSRCEEGAQPHCSERHSAWIQCQCLNSGELNCSWIILCFSCPSHAQHDLWMATVLWIKVCILVFWSLKLATGLVFVV